MTVVECILQVVKADPTARVLACAPSNEAADLICLRLSEVMGREFMFRLNAFMRDPHHVDAEIMSYSLRHSGAFQLPSNANLQEYRVIVCTCSSSGYLYRSLSSLPPTSAPTPQREREILIHFFFGSAGLKNHFSHVFIDESGEALEPEALVPLQSASPTATVIFSGDPKQLGPIVRSPLALKYGLNRSVLERLVDGFDEYLAEEEERRANGGEEGISFFCGKKGALVIQLRESYRAHQAILDSYSRLFYFGRLTSSAPREITHSLLGWDLLPNREVGCTSCFPLFAHQFP